MVNTTIQRPKGPKGKNVMSDSNVANPALFTASVSRKIKDVDGKEIERKGKMDLPLAVDQVTALAISDNKEDELVFWFNHGRKLHAAAVVRARLDFTLGSKELDTLYEQYNDAINAQLEEKATAEEREFVTNFVKKIKKFQPMLERLEAMKSSGVEELYVDFRTEKLERPSGVKGRKAGSKDEPETKEETVEVSA